MSDPAEGPESGTDLEQRGAAMTICIGALCADSKGNAGRAVVVASDRLISTTAFAYQFERPIPKVKKVNDRTVVLLANDATRGMGLTDELEAALNGVSPLPSTQLVAEMLATLYRNRRLAQIEKEVFLPRNLTGELFYRGGAQRQLADQFVTNLDSWVVQYNYNVDLLVAGTDDYGASLYWVGHPGLYADCKAAGFGAIGGGWNYAVPSLVSMGHTANATIEDTIFNVFVARKRAAFAPGVGAVHTDMRVVHDGAVIEMTPDQITALDTLYSAHQTKERLDARAGVEALKIVPR